MAEPAGQVHASASHRDPVWVALSVFVVLGVGYLLIPHDAHPGSIATRIELVVYTIPQLLAITFTAFVSRKALGTERVFWSLLSGVNAFIFLYDLPWTIEMWNGRQPPPTETLASTAAFLIPTAAFAALLVSMNRRPVDHPVDRIRYLVDGLAVLVVVFVAYHTFFVRPYFVSHGIVESAAHMRTALHATIGIGALTGMLANVSGLRTAGWRRWEQMVVAGVCTYAIGLALMPFYVVGIRVSPHVGTQVIELLLLGGHYLVFAGALSRLNAEAVQPDLARYEPPITAHKAVSAIYHVALLTAVAVLGTAAVMVGDVVPDRPLYLGAAIAICTLLGVRAVVDAIDTGAYFKRSITDDISGARTFRFFRERLGNEVELCRRCAEPLAVVVVDLDGFHSLNGSGENGSGESVLKDAVGAMVPLVGAADTLARVDGDTFAMLLVGANRVWANEIAEGLRRAVRESTGMTISAGVALFPEHGLEASEIYARAERALIWAQAHGPDRLAVYDSELMRMSGVIDQREVRNNQMSVAAIKSLAAAVDARNVDTRYHSQSVADLAVLFARHLGLDAETVRRLEAAALMHDVGKIGISDRILRKRGPLNPAERAEVREHPVLSERILAGSALRQVSGWVRSHHERWDGTGYPDQRAGEEVPLESRILTLCDSYDAMTSPRSYRSRLSAAAALQEIDLCMGTQFDPELAEEFIVVVRTNVDPEPRVH